MNYLGDWGKQYGLLAVGYERYGSEEALVNDPINHLFHVYVSINVSSSFFATGQISAILFHYLSIFNTIFFLA